MSLVLLLVLTINACTTIEYVYPDYKLPEEPQRQELKIPESTEDYKNILGYYELLVQQWEQWAKSVKKIIEKKEE